jgi:hypothetical protein
MLDVDRSDSAEEGACYGGCRRGAYVSLLFSPRDKKEEIAD